MLYVSEAQKEEFARLGLSPDEGTLCLKMGVAPQAYAAQKAQMAPLPTDELGKRQAAILRGMAEAVGGDVAREELRRMADMAEAGGPVNDAGR